MDAIARKQLNHRVRAMAHGRLKLDEESYRDIVRAVDQKSDGHISRCDDEHANLVLKVLERMLERNPQGTSSQKIANEHQQKLIARLMYCLGWNWGQTSFFCERQTGKKSTRDCSAKELSKVILGMIRIVESDIKRGRTSLTAKEIEDFRSHTRQYRSSSFIK